MTKDIVERLRECANGVGNFKNDKGDFGLCDDAADEMERLRAAIERQKHAALNLQSSTMEQVRHLQEKDRSEYAAAKTLDSEREANARLTEENERLRATLRDIIPMTDEIANAPMTADRWADRIEDKAREALGD